MRTALARHLRPLLRLDASGQPQLLAFLKDDQLPDEFSWHDYAIFLLHVAAEIEHALMVQYLYAAYSVGGAGLPDEVRERARVWREIILGIAKEEMGHLITVQNLLRALGGPLHLEREDYPHRNEFYPFQFRLEPLTKTSLAKYIYAEAPADWEGVEADEIRERAGEATGGTLNRVGALYEGLIRLIGNPQRIPDSAFLRTTLPYQATWDEWGRGYRRGARGDQSGANVPETPDLLIDRVSNRTTAVDALRRIAAQGESPVTQDEPRSHFARFLEIYRAIDEANPPSRPVPSNPTTNADDPQGRTVISHPTAARWCRLFDLRYRMLLFRLKHAFFVRAGESTDRPTGRGSLIAWTFGEMYNLRALAGIVMDQPLDTTGGAMRAAPPFEMPYTLSLADWDSDKWRTHRDLIAASKSLSQKLVDAGDGHAAFLQALSDNDDLADGIVQELMRVALEQEGRL